MTSRDRLAVAVRWAASSRKANLIALREAGRLWLDPPAEELTDTFHRYGDDRVAMVKAIREVIFGEPS